MAKEKVKSLDELTLEEFLQKFPDKNGRRERVRELELKRQQSGKISRAEYWGVHINENRPEEVVEENISPGGLLYALSRFINLYGGSSNIVPIQKKV